LHSHDEQEKKLSENIESISAQLRHFFAPPASTIILDNWDWYKDVNVVPLSILYRVVSHFRYHNFSQEYYYRLYLL
jgi:tyrosyl-tRNA synthetase